MFGRLLDEKQIESHVLVWNKTERQDGTFSQSDFEWNEQVATYRLRIGVLLLCEIKHKFAIWPG